VACLPAVQALLLPVSPPQVVLARQQAARSPAKEHKEHKQQQQHARLVLQYEELLHRVLQVRSEICERFKHSVLQWQFFVKVERLKTRVIMAMS
jgi:hypothetical protein